MELEPGSDTAFEPGMRSTPPASGGFHEFLWQLFAELRESRDPDKLLRHSLRRARDFFAADRGCIAIREPGNDHARVLLAYPAESDWDLELLAELIQGRVPRVPRGTIFSPIARHRRPWGVMVLRRDREPFEKGSGRKLTMIATEVAELIHRADRERLLEVRGRIDGKLMRPLSATDLYYQILDGLHLLTRYDHSSALLIFEPASASLDLVAEQIAWRKAKSGRIGLRFAWPRKLAGLMSEGTVYGFDREGARWREWTAHGAEPLAAWLDEALGQQGAGAPREGAMLCAPLGTRDGPLGLLELTDLHPGKFGVHEVEILERFTPLASIVIQRSQATESLQEKMLSAERKHAIADLARGVAHDINNALGAVLPLVQQMRDDLVSDAVSREAFAEDLEEVEQSLQVCRRIFGNMLSFARGSARHLGEGKVQRAVQSTCGVLADSMERQGIRLELAVPDDLPAVAAGQGDLEQLFLNLATNARDAMPGGGTLRIAASHADGQIEVSITDTGNGIPVELLSRVEEPFFTTKPQGTGLGLSVCRSIVSEMRGELELESRPGEGTHVKLQIPVKQPR